MIKSISRPMTACFLVLTLLASTPLFAKAGARRIAPARQSDEGKDKDKGKKDKKENKDDKKDETDKPTKQERKYQEIKRFSEDLYGKEPEFHDEVEDAFRQKQREHSNFAYQVNTREPGDERFERLLRDSNKAGVVDTLYDNPLVQDYVNRVGHSIVPKDSTRLYAFKVTLNPIPEARSLSTGTIYVSSGLLSLIDNEAQLAYILGHEIAHVERDHWHEDVLVLKGMDRWNEKQQKKRSIIGAVATVATMGIAGGQSGSLANALYAGSIVSSIAPSILKFVVPNAAVSWDKIQEDEADQLGLKYMFDRSYDPREVPKFYAALQRTSQRDRRVGLGFMGDPARLVDRSIQVAQVVTSFRIAPTAMLYAGASTLSAQQATQSAPKSNDSSKGLDPSRDAASRAGAAEKAISGNLSADINAKLDSGELIGSTAEFEALMAELKRDNGIRAYEYDMFQMARDNLEESLRIRSNDPNAHLYYGKVMKLTARNAAEKSRALAEIVRAIELDKRKVLPDAHLHRALAVIEGKDQSQTAEIISSLKEYVSIYQREHGGALPPNMSVIYDYMQEAGEMLWSARPATNVSTKNIDPINTAAGSAARPAETIPATPVDTATKPRPKGRP
jgi:Zn-dependent protease with chaperone function